jgi:parallel beta-helix repeat protein
MKSLAVCLGLLGLACVAAVQAVSGSGADETAATTLPGARTEIDAARFPNLQAALDALPEEGGLVKLPPGTFEIDRPLVLRRGDVLLQGSGTATHIKNMNQEGHPALLLEHPKGEKASNSERLWRIQLANFRITGNEKSGAGIVAKRINEVFLEGVTVSYHGGDGIVLDHCYEDPRVIGCLITYNKQTGLNLIGCHDIVVSSCQFEENHDALHCFDGFNLCMTGNCLDDHLGHGVVIENTYGSVVSGNMIEECKGQALIMDRDCYGNTVSANVIAHNGGGVELLDAHGCAISANTFTINNAFGVRVAAGSGRITLTGNNFSNSYLGDGKVKRASNDWSAGGLLLEGTSDVAVVGNVFSGVRPKALESQGDQSQRVNFSHNVLTDVESDHGQLQNSLANGNLE